MPHLLCLNGPNLDLLGRRDPTVYGHTTLAELESRVVAWASEVGASVVCRQSNSESQLVEWIHDSAGVDGLVLNAGALSHTSSAVADAVAAVSVPMAEVHISNVGGRERWRRRSRLTAEAVVAISGRGIRGYQSAIHALINHAAGARTPHRYGPHPDQVVDLWQAPEPVGGAVVVHGGFWRDVWGRDSVWGWGPALTALGLSVASIGYRRLGSGGGDPATYHDVAEAVDAATELLPGPVVLVGHSAGAQLAAWLSATDGPDAVAFVGVGGIYDLRGDARQLGDGAVGEFSPDGAGSPIELDPPPGRIVLVHGERDRAVPVAQSHAYAEAMERAGSEVVVDVVEDAGHFDALDTRSETWRRVATHVRDTVGA